MVGTSWCWKTFSFGSTNGLDYGFPICFFPQRPDGVSASGCCQRSTGTGHDLNSLFEESAGTVRLLSRFTGRIPEPDALATSIGVGRLVLSGALLAAPTASVRILGVDSASAKRMAFL